jgi:hypothetical protein
VGSLSEIRLQTLGLEGFQPSSGMDDPSCTVLQLAFGVEEETSKS